MVGMETVIGVDVGGTKVAAAVVGGGDLTARVEHPTELGDGAALLDGIAAVVAEVEQGTARAAVVGVGLPSQIEFSSGTVVASANIPLQGVPVREELQRRLGRPVFVDNDANCAALAEAGLGGVDDLVMLTLGTGVGGGVVIDGQIFRGSSGLGAELGHIVIERDGPECPGACPSRGCLEAFCSGTALAREALAYAEAHPDSQLGRELAQEGRVSGRVATEAAQDGDPDALALLQQLGVSLGVGMAGLINIFEPQRLVIGGGLSAAGDLFMPHAISEAESRALPALYERVTIGLARGGGDAGIIGAGTLAAHEFQRSNRGEG